MLNALLLSSPQNTQLEMKQLLLLIICTALLQALPAAELVTLKSTDGRTIQASIDNFTPRNNQLTVRINGQGKRVSFGIDRLDKASQQVIAEWYETYSVLKSLTIHSERIPARNTKNRIFEIELSCAAEKDIKNVRIDYIVPLKRYTMKEAASSTAKATKYEKVLEETVIKGSIKVGTIAARSKRNVYSEEIEASSTQSIPQGKGKDPKEVTNKNSIKGILLKIYVDDKLLREYESQNGVKELIQKYRKG